MMGQRNEKTDEGSVAPKDSQIATRGDRPLTDIARHAAQKRDYRRDPGPSPLRGFGSFGTIGWSIALPTVVGALVGMRLDRHAAHGSSWTIALILGGLAAGILIAFLLVNQDHQP